jgi:hypothetical protein
MILKNINQKKAVKMLISGQAISEYQINFNDEKVEALDAFLLRNISVNQLLDNLMKDFYKNAKATSMRG